MKKTYIALAASAAFVASGVATAEVSVGLKHQIQVVNYSFDDADHKDGLYMADGGIVDHAGGGTNRFSLKGSRDLGGMTAFAQVDTNQGTFGTGGFGGREALVGLSGDFGRIRMGRINTPYATGEPLQTTFMQARGNGGRLGPSSGLGNGSYRDGVVRYDNSFGGVKFDAALLVDTAVDYDNAGNQTSNDGNHAMSFKLSMPVGPANAYVAHTAADNYTGWETEDEPGTVENVTIDGTDYTLLTDPDGPAPSKLGGDKQSLTKIGAVADMGNLRIQAEYEMLSEDMGDGNFMFLSGQFGLSDSSSVVANYGSFASESGDFDASYMAVGYLQSLGENTRAHVGYRSSTGDGMAAAGVGDTTAIGGGLTVSF